LAPSRAIETGGYLGLGVAALAAYLSLAELCEASYKRSILPLWPLAKH
jgi:succinate-acetate transporter protein